MGLAFEANQINKGRKMGKRVEAGQDKNPQWKVVDDASHW